MFRICDSSTPSIVALDLMYELTVDTAVFFQSSLSLTALVRLSLSSVIFEAELIELFFGLFAGLYPAFAFGYPPLEFGPLPFDGFGKPFDSPVLHRNGFG